jgi:hypothetical protein
MFTSYTCSFYPHQELLCEKSSAAQDGQEFCNNAVPKEGTTTAASAGVAPFQMLK